MSQSHQALSPTHNDRNHLNSEHLHSISTPSSTTAYKHSPAFVYILTEGQTRQDESDRSRSIQGVGRNNEKRTHQSHCFTSHTATPVTTTPPVQHSPSPSHCRSPHGGELQWLFIPVFT
ncbi:hypothetical protein M9458_052938, partial [Cirrhinus mrigala]